MKPFIHLGKRPDGTLTLVAIIVEESTETENRFTSATTLPIVTVVDVLAKPYTALLYENALDVDITALELETKKSINLGGATIPLSNPLRALIGKGALLVSTIGSYDVNPQSIAVAESLVESTAFEEFKEANLESILVASNSLQSFLKRHAFKKHVLLIGQSGLGKTTESIKYFKEAGIKYYHKALDNGTDVFDLLGGLNRTSDGSFVWGDGVLTAAFRAAARGEKVVLFLDEMLRAPKKEQSVLVGSLSTDGDGHYVLNTGRMLEDKVTDGVMDTELLKAPVENFWLVATTNQGAGYHTERIDEALKQRFRLYELTVDVDAFTVIMQTIAEKYFPTCSDSIVVSLMAIKKEIDNQVNTTGMLKTVISVRHFKEVMELADNISDVKQRLVELIPNLVSADSKGDLNSTQIALVQEIINTNWAL